MTLDTDATPFDGSTQHDAAPNVGPPRTQPALTGFSALDALDEQIRERDEEAVTTTTVDIPGLEGVRLLCSTVVPYEDFQQWQKASFSPRDRKKRRPNGLDMSQMVLACMVLTNTCEAIEHVLVSTGEWVPMLGSDGEPFTLESEELLRHYGLIDPALFIKRLFGRDPDVLAAGEAVMRASKWLEDDDDEDPTE